MTSETITYNNKKVIKKTNSNGEVSYILRGLYLGIDENRQTSNNVYNS